MFDTCRWPFVEHGTDNMAYDLSNDVKGVSVSSRHCLDPGYAPGQKCCRPKYSRPNIDKLRSKCPRSKCFPWQNVAVRSTRWWKPRDPSFIYFDVLTACDEQQTSVWRWCTLAQQELSPCLQSIDACLWI